MVYISRLCKCVCVLVLDDNRTQKVEVLTHKRSIYRSDKAYRLLKQRDSLSDWKSPGLDNLSPDYLAWRGLVNVYEYEYIPYRF